MGNSDKIQELFELQRTAVSDSRVSGLDERRDHLRNLRKVILESQQQLHQALYADFGKSAAEVDLSEHFTTLSELEYALKKLHRWMRPERVATPLSMLGTRSEIQYSPKGVVLIIGAWNYPYSLVLVPLIAALAAGNRAILKPSELCPQTSALINKIIGQVFSPDQVAVVEGDADVSQKLLSLPFDHIFFTGSTRVGTIVAKAAAKQLIPVTLELGGKSPVIVDESADLEKAAERIAWGKFLNAGQTCVAPDYVFVQDQVFNEFIVQLKKSIVKMFPHSDSLCQIVTQSNFDRLKKLLQDAISEGASIPCGGGFDESTRHIAPTVLTNLKLKTSIMYEEIFGPLLPVFSYSDIEEVLEFVKPHPKPLALYVFSESKEQIECILERLPSGGACINNTVVHLLNPGLPFGGVGASGVGNYHGIHGFRTFSHARSVVTQRWGNALKPLYPPYTSRVQWLIRMAVRFLTK